MCVEGMLFIRLRCQSSSSTSLSNFAGDEDEEEDHDVPTSTPDADSIDSGTVDVAACTKPSIAVRSATADSLAAGSILSHVEPLIVFVFDDFR